VTKIDDTEIVHGAMIPTYFLLSKLQSADKYRDAQLFFVIGSDLLPTLHLWHEADKLKQEFPFLVFVRPNWAEGLKPENMPSKYQTLDSAWQCDMSSTRLRLRIEADLLRHPGSAASHLGVFGMVGPRVIEYIKARGLYGQAKS
jgi:nicotinic acid mononucleotide adenylyltransferase